MLVSALTGFGMDTLRAEMAALLASLWVDVDVALPYAAGELLARVRERGTVDIEYRERDVRIRGRVAPSLAGELEAAAERWADAMDGAGTKPVSPQHAGITDTGLRGSHPSVAAVTGGTRRANG